MAKVFKRADINPKLLAYCPNKVGAMTIFTLEGKTYTIAPHPEDSDKVFLSRQKDWERTPRFCTDKTLF